jgi:hypothetical protein
MFRNQPMQVGSNLCNPSHPVLLDPCVPASPQPRFRFSNDRNLLSAKRSDYVLGMISARHDDKCPSSFGRPVAIGKRRSKHIGARLGIGISDGSFVD